MSIPIMVEFMLPIPASIDNKVDEIYVEAVLISIEQYLEETFLTTDFKVDW